MAKRRQQTLRKTGRSRTVKPYWQMTSAQLAAATREFDKEFIADTFGKAPPSAKVQLRRAKRPGRPKIGKGARRVLVTVERGLLAEADAFARRHKINRSQLVAAGLRKIISPKAA
jgi:hypothetical protein